MRSCEFTNINDMIAIDSENDQLLEAVLVCTPTKKFECVGVCVDIRSDNRTPRMTTDPFWNQHRTRKTFIGVPMDTLSDRNQMRVRRIVRLLQTSAHGYLEQMGLV